MLTNNLESKIDEVTKVDAGTVTITYNQKHITVAPGEDLDVREFGIPTKSIEAVEKHILRKNPNIFKQTKTADIFKNAKATLNKIKELEKEVAGLKEEIRVQINSKEEYVNEASKVKAENEGLTRDNKSLKGKVKSLEAKVKALS